MNAKTKFFLFLFLALVTLFTLAACGANGTWSYNGTIEFNSPVDGQLTIKEGGSLICESDGGCELTDPTGSSFTLVKGQSAYADEDLVFNPTSGEILAGTVTLSMSEEPAAEEPAAEEPAAEEAEEPEAEVEEAADEQEPASDDGYPTFSYVPGGEGFGEFAFDVDNPDPDRYTDEEACGRLWQATNLENLPWTFVLCNFEASDPAPRMQWPHPTQFTVTGEGSVRFELWRDHGANDASSPSPYDTANVKDSPLGLGWFAQGFNASICVYANGEKLDDSCQALNGGGVYQVGFPEDMEGFYEVVLTVNDGQLQFWQGEKLTTEDNWPQPDETPTEE